MKDSVTVQVETRIWADGRTERRYSFACDHCDANYTTRRRRRILWTLRTHRYICRGYKFPGTINDL